MAGRPKRDEEVAAMTLRIPPALLERVNRCKARIELQDGKNLSRTEVLWRIIAAGCEVLEGQVALPEPIVIPEKPEEPQTPEAPEMGSKLPPHIVQIAETAAEYHKLSLAELSQLLFERGIYRSMSKDGREVPVNRGTLQKWLERAEEAGLL
jgi:hypothetical protein